MNLEDQLRHALKREDPPEGFAGRVLEQTGSAPVAFRQPQRKPWWRLWLPSVSFAAAAAAVVLSMSVQYRHKQEEEAGRQAALALRIASEKLNLARNKVINK